MAELDVKPLRKWVPENLEFEELSTDEIWIEKEGTRDNTLDPYLRDGTVRVLKSHQLDELILEKRINERHEDPLREVAFSVLLDEVGSTRNKVAPSISYVREEDGELFYGQEFMSDFGPLNDQKLNNISDAEEYLEAAGKVTGTYNWLDIMHGDLTKIYTSGPLRGLPESKNILFSGSHAEAIGIDLETAFFDQNPRPIINHSSGLYEMNPKRSDDEYDALRRTMEANIIARHLPDYFDRITEAPLRDQNGEFNTNILLRYDGENTDVPGENNYMVDFNKLQEFEEDISGEINTTLAENLLRMDKAYEKGFDIMSEKLRDKNGDFSAGFIEEANTYSTIPTDITDFQTLYDEKVSDIARMRWEEVYDELDDSFSGR